VQHILVVGGGPQLDGLPPVHLREIASSGIEWAIATPRFGGFPYTPLDALITGAGLVDAVLAGATDETRAVLVDTFGEYGMLAMRSAVTVPVVGAAEAAIAEALERGDRFGIVSVWPASLEWLYEERLREHQATDQCAGIRFVGAAALDRGTAADTLDAMHRSDSDWLERIVASAEALIDDGARSIVLGCTCMAPVAASLSARLRVPAICAARAGARAALAAARGERPVSRVVPQATADTRAAFSSWVAQGVGGSAAEDAAAACPVCITDPAPVGR
jgi:allantoin racemase